MKGVSRSRSAAWMALAAALSLSAAPAPETGAARAPDEEWLEGLLRERRSARPGHGPDLGERVAGAGVEALPAVFAALCGDPVFAGDERGPLFDAGAWGELEEALASWPHDEVVEGLARETRDAPLARRWVALGLLADVGGAGALGLVERLLRGMAPEDRADGRTRAAVRRAVAGILARDPAAFSVLGEGAWDGAGGARTARAVVQALGDTADGRAVASLTAHLGVSAELDAAVVDALGRLAPWEPECLDGRRERWIERFLLAPDPRLRRSAARALARMGDDGVFDGLVGMLDDADSGVRHEAWRALAELTGRRFHPDPERWAEYGRAEERWWEERAEALLSRAAGSDAGAAVRALREVAPHRLLARRLAPRLAEVLPRADPVVARAACDALVRLGDASVARDLADLLLHADHDVRPALERCLSELTGIPPAYLGSWRARLRG